MKNKLLYLLILIILLCVLYFVYNKNKMIVEKFEISESDLNKCRANKDFVKCIII